MPWYHGSPKPSFLGVITHICSFLGCKTFMFHGFGVQGYEVKNHQQVVKSKQRWVPPEVQQRVFPWKVTKSQKERIVFQPPFSRGTSGVVPFNDPWIFAMSGVITLIYLPLKMGNRGETHTWLVVSTHLKNISQIGNRPQIGMNIKIFETTS